MASAFASVMAFGVLLNFDTQHNLVLRNGVPVVSVPHLVDLGNSLVVLAPSALLLPAVALLRSREQWRPTWLPAAVATLAIATLAFVRPPQGAVRDWDVYALAGLLLSAFLAVALGKLVDAVRPGGWGLLAVAVVVGFPTVQWAANAHDRFRGLDRIESIASLAHLSSSDRAQVLDYLGSQQMSDGQWEEAATTLQSAVSLAPHRRLYLMWALAETATEDYERAAEAYGKMLKVLGPDPIGYLGLAGAAAAIGDTVQSRMAAEQLRGLPASQVAQCVAYVRKYPQIWPTADRDLLRYALEPALRRR
jgi:tetratricopeptide (TPR) repeat protein